VVWIVQRLEATVPRRYRPGGLVIDFRLPFKNAYDCYELFSGSATRAKPLCTFASFI